MNRDELIHDWNVLPGSFDYSTCGVELDDETLRDGLQNPSVTDPPIDKKIELLHHMVDLGIDSADIGLPGAGPRAYDAVLALAREVVEHDLPIAPSNDWTLALPATGLDLELARSALAGLDHIEVYDPTNEPAPTQSHNHDPTNDEIVIDLSALEA